MRRLIWIAVGVFVACSSSPAPRASLQIDVTSEVSETDYSFCANLCEKKQRCTGQAPSGLLVKNCADDCFERISHQHVGKVRVRGMSACMDLPCGPEFQKCANTISAVATMVTKPAPNPPLSIDNCRKVCSKTFECLGGNTPLDSAVDACAKSCVELTKNDNNNGRRLRAIHRCAMVVCGLQYRQCVRDSTRIQ